MPFDGTLGNLLMQTSLTTGSGPKTFNATPLGYRALSAVYAQDVIFPYTAKGLDIFDNETGAYEVGYGHLDSLGRLVTDTIHESSNANAAVVFSSHKIRIVVDLSKQALEDLIALRSVPVARTVTAGNGLTGGGALSSNITLNVAATDASISVAADGISVGVLQTDVQHGARGGGTQHSVATGAVAGFMSAADKTKLDGLPSSAVPTTTQVIAGAGMAGGGALSGDVTLNVIANADGSIAVNANDLQVGVLATDAQHGARGGGTQHSVASGVAAGFMSAAHFTKLEDVPTPSSIVTGSLTAGRVPYVSGPTSLQDSANLMFDGSNLTVTDGTANTLVIGRSVSPNTGDTNTVESTAAPGLVAQMATWSDTASGMTAASGTGPADIWWSYLTASPTGLSVVMQAVNPTVDGFRLDYSQGSVDPGTLRSGTLVLKAEGGANHNFMEFRPDGSFLLDGDAFSTATCIVRSQGGDLLIEATNGEISIVTSGGALLSLGTSNATVNTGKTLTTTGTGNIDLPNNASARFKIEGSAVSANVTATNLGTLTAGASSNASSLHRHGNFTTAADGFVPASVSAVGNFLRDDSTWATIFGADVALNQVVYGFGTNSVQSNSGFQYDGTNARVLNGGIGVGDAVGSANLLVNARKDNNGVAVIQVANLTNGNAASAQVQVSSTATGGLGQLISYAVSGSYTTSGLIVADSAAIQSTSNLTAGLRIFTSGSAPLILGTNDTARMTFGGGGELTLEDGLDVIVGTSTGTKIGTATTQKLGFFNKTPVVQPTGVADASGGAIIDAEARTAINAVIANLESLGLQAVV